VSSISRSVTSNWQVGGTAITENRSHDHACYFLNFISFSVFMYIFLLIIMNGYGGSLVHH